MESLIDPIVDDYEKGKLSRRQLVVHLAAIVTTVAATGSGATAAAAETSTFTATGLNHLALNVADIQRSRDFYIRHLGLKVNRQSAANCFMTFGQNFLALFRSGGASMNHYCFSVQDFDPSRSVEMLESQGLQPRRSGNRVYFDDPDGHEVQLASESHRP